MEILVRAMLEWRGIGGSGNVGDIKVCDTTELV